MEWRGLVAADRRTPATWSGASQPGARRHSQEKGRLGRPRRPAVGRGGPGVAWHNSQPAKHIGAIPASPKILFVPGRAPSVRLVLRGRDKTRANVALSTRRSSSFLTSQRWGEGDELLVWQGAAGRHGLLHLAPRGEVGRRPGEGPVGLLEPIRYAASADIGRAP
jgi:hypothetical protein